MKTYTAEEIEKIESTIIWDDNIDFDYLKDKTIYQLFDSRRKYEYIDQGILLYTGDDELILIGAASEKVYEPPYLMIAVGKIEEEKDGK